MGRYLIPLTLALIMLCLSASPAAQAKPDWGADLTATAVRVQESHDTGGNLAAFLNEHQPLDQEQISSAMFMLGAELLNITTYEDDSYVSDSSSIGGPLENSQVRMRDYEGGKLEGIANRPGHEMGIYAHNANHPPTITSKAQCSSYSPPDKTEVVRKNHAMQDHEVYRHLGGTVLWQSDCVAGYTFQGDLLITLWEWDSQLETSDGNKQDLQTGLSKHSLAPEGADLTEVAAHVRQIFVIAYNATLVVPPSRSETTSIYVMDSNLRSDGRIEIENAQGVLKGKDPQTVNRELLAVQGDLQLRIRGESPNRPLRIAMTGDLDYAEAGDRIILWTTAPSNGAGGANLLRLGAIIAGSVGMMGLVTTYSLPTVAYYFLHYSSSMRLQGSLAGTWRQKRGATYWVLHQKAQERGRDRLALLWLQLAKRTAPHHAAYHVAQLLPLKRMQRLEDAIKVHQHLDKILLADSESRALNAFQAALTAHEAGQEENANNWIEKAWRHDATAINLLLMEPSFAWLREESWMQRSNDNSRNTASPAYT